MKSHTSSVHATRANYSLIFCFVIVVRTQLQNNLTGYRLAGKAIVHKHNMSWQASDTAAYTFTEAKFSHVTILVLNQSTFSRGPCMNTKLPMHLNFVSVIHVRRQVSIVIYRNYTCYYCIFRNNKRYCQTFFTRITAQRQLVIRKSRLEYGADYKWRRHQS